jgi:hypothetical protein
MNPRPDPTDQDIACHFAQLRAERRDSAPDFHQMQETALKIHQIEPIRRHPWIFPSATAAVLALSLGWFAMKRSQSRNLPESPSLLAAKHDSSDLVVVPAPLFAVSEVPSASLLHQTLEINIFP